jgi:hypothetical protein
LGGLQTGEKVREKREIMNAKVKGASRTMLREDVGREDEEIL